MKKFFFLAVVLLLASIAVFAQEQEQEQIYIQTQPTQAQEPGPEDRPIEFHMNFTNFGFGISMPFMTEFSLELLKFGIENKNSGFGVSFRPFNFFGWVGPGKGTKENGDPEIYTMGGVSLINMTLYWNMIKLFADNEKFYIAPFVDVNYLFMSDDIDVTKYMFSAGLQGGIRGGSRIKYNNFSIDTGFRLKDNKTLFFATIKFDFIMYILQTNRVIS